MTALLTQNTLFSLCGHPQCTTVAPPRSCGTPHQELTAVSHTSSLDVIPPVSSTQKIMEKTFMTHGTDRSSLLMLRECSTELMFCHSRSPLTINQTRKWSSSSQVNLAQKTSTSSLAPACVLWLRKEPPHPMVSCHLRAGKFSLHTISLFNEHSPREIVIYL